MKTFCTAVIALVLFVGCHSQQETELIDSPYPYKVTERLHLDAEETGVKYREVTVWEGTEVPKFAIVQYANGVTGQERYREDGTLETAIEQFPASGDSTRRQLKLALRFEEDGKSLDYQEIYREDGTCKLKGSRKPDGKFESTSYFPDGKQVQIHQVNTRGNALLTSEEFRQNGLLAKSYRRLRHGREELTLYRENGQKLQSTNEHRTDSYADVYRNFYDHQGRMYARVRYASTCIEIAYLNDKEHAEEVWSYARNGGLVVTHFGPSETQLFRQHWTSNPGLKEWTRLGDTKLECIQVLKYQIIGKVLFNDLKITQLVTERKYDLYGDQRTPKIIWEPDGRTNVSGKYRRFREDGTLEKEEFWKWHMALEETEFSREENIREQVPEALLKRLSKRSVPKMLDPMPLEDEHANGCGTCCESPPEPKPDFKFVWWQLPLDD